MILKQVQRLNASFVLLLLFGVLSPVLFFGSDAIADDGVDGELWALWSSPGGNIIQIRNTAEGWRGELVKVSEWGLQVGFKQGQQVLKDFSIDNRKICFDVGIKEALEKEMEYGRFCGNLSSSKDVLTSKDEVMLSGTLRAKGSLALEIYSGGGGLDDLIAPAAPPDSSEESTTPAPERPVEMDRPAGADEQSVSVTYSQMSILSHLPKLGPFYRLVSTQRSLDIKSEIAIEASAEYPLGRNHSALEIRVELVNGEPVEFSEVVWTVDRWGEEYLKEKYYTITNGEGITRLVFGVLPTGDFVPINQIKAPPTGSLPGGTYSVTATIPQLDSNASIEFQVRLTADPLLEFFEGVNNRMISTLVYDEADRERGLKPFSIRIFNKNSDLPDTLPVTLRSVNVVYNEKGQPREEECGLARITLRPSGSKGEYLLGNVIEATPALCDSHFYDSDRKLRIPKESFLSPNPRGVVEVTAIEERYLVANTMRIYSSIEALRKDQVRNLLIEFQRTIDDLKQSVVPGSLTDAQKENLDQKSGLIERGLFLLSEKVFDELVEKGARPEDVNLLQRALGDVYVELVRRNCVNRVTIASTDSGDPLKFQYKLKTGCYGKTIAKQHRINPWILNSSNATPQNTVAIDVRLEAELSEVQKRNHIFLQSRYDQAAKFDSEREFAEAWKDFKKEAQLIIPAIVSSPFHMVYALAFGTTLDGQNLTTLDRLWVGLDFASFRLNTRWRASLGKYVSEKAHLIEEIRAFNPGLSAGAGFEFEEVLLRRRLQMFGEEALEEARFAAIERILRAPVSEEIKNAQLAALQRITSYRLGEQIRNRMKIVEEVYGTANLEAAKLTRTMMGSLMHYVQYYVERAFLENSPDWTVTEPGRRFRQVKLNPDGTKVPGPLEIMIEWTVPIPEGIKVPKSMQGRKSIRIDRVEVMHEPVTLEAGPFRGTVRIVDLVRDLNWTHREKTEFYQQVLRRQGEFKGYFIQATELEWNEKSGQILEQTLASWYEMPD